MLRCVRQVGACASVGVRAGRGDGAQREHAPAHRPRLHLRAPPASAPAPAPTPAAAAPTAAASAPGGYGTTISNYQSIPAS